MAHIVTIYAEDREALEDAIAQLETDVDISEVQNAHYPQNPVTRYAMSYHHVKED